MAYFGRSKNSPYLLGQQNFIICDFNVNHSGT